MASITDKILDISRRTKELSKELEDIKDAPQIFAASSNRIEELETKVTQLVEKLPVQEKVAEFDHRQLQKLRGSHIKHLLGRHENHEAKVADAEKEYTQADKTASASRKELDDLHKELESERRSKEKYGPSAKHSQQLQDELDTLHDSVFGRPTSDFPEEDAQRDTVASAQSKYEDIRGRLENEKLAVMYLQEALKKMGQAVFEIRTAANEGSLGMFGLGGISSDRFKVEEHNMAKNHLHEARELVEEAARLSPQIKALENVDVGDPNADQGLLRMNLQTNFGQTYKLNEFTASAKQAMGRLDGQLQAAHGRAAGLQKQLSEASSRLAREKNKLRQLRQDIIIQVTKDAKGV